MKWRGKGRTFLEENTVIKVDEIMMMLLLLLIFDISPFSFCLYSTQNMDILSVEQPQPKLHYPYNKVDDNGHPDTKTCSTLYS